MAQRGRYDVDVRYHDAQDARSRISLCINGQQQGSPCESLGLGRGWTSFTVPNVSIGSGDQIAIEVRADSGEPAKLDYVQLAYLGAGAD